MKKNLLTGLLLLISITGYPQTIFEKSYVYFGGNYGLYFSNADNFEAIYKDDLHLTTFFGGFGYDNISIIAKYKQFATKGASKVKNIPAKGVADWNQEFYSIGLRVFNNNPVYFDLCYVETKVTEKIGTKNPVLIELESETIIRDNGVSLTFGGCLPIYPKTAYLTCDFEYMLIHHWMNEDDNDSSVLSLGGYSFNIGLIIGLEL